MAWTERYVDAAANGSGNGTTQATSGATGAWTLTQAVAGYAAGQRLNVKPGTYANTTTVFSLTTAGTTTSPVWWRGYNTTIGDIDLDQTLSKPLLTFTTGSWQVTGAHQLFSNMSFQGASTDTSGVIGVGTDSLRWDRCRVENTAANANGFAASAGASTVGNMVFSRCWFKATSTATAVIRSGTSGSTPRQVDARGCVFTGGGHGLLNSNAAPAIKVSGCAFVSCGGDGIHVDSTAPVALVVEGCTFYGSGSDGVELAILSGNTYSVSDCLLVSNGGYGINNSTGANTNFVHRHNNAFYSNTSGKENGFGDSPSLSEVVETSSPFVNAPTDLSLLAAALSKAAGSPYPGTFENVAYTGYLDVGAVQRQETGMVLARAFLGM